MNKGKDIAIDSMILIYLIEGREPFCNVIKKVLEAARRISFSSFGLGEVLAGFEKTGDKQGKIKFLSFVESYEKLSIIGFGKQEALIFAELRAKYPSVKPPDAIHLATAISARVDGFLTNDKNLMKVKELSILRLDSF